MRTWSLLLPFVAVLGASAAAPNPFGASRWGAKPVALERLPERATFPVLLPKHLSSRFQLDRAEIVWVSPSALFPNVAGRQAVGLWYRVGDEGVVLVI